MDTTNEVAERDRDRVLDEAILAGKFPAHRRAHYEAAWARDPEATRSTIAKLAGGLVEPGGEPSHEASTAAVIGRRPHGFVESANRTPTRRNR
jgi:hypothetical protein